MKQRILVAGGGGFIGGHWAGVLKGRGHDVVVADVIGLRMGIRKAFHWTQGELATRKRGEDVVQ
jgi:nucleoside-diphosphate-sugar epimerase